MNRSLEKRFKAYPSFLPSGALLLLGMLGFSLLTFFLFTNLLSLPRWSAVWHYRSVFWHGWLETVFISLLALGFSSLLGLLLAFARRSSFVPIRVIALFFIEVIRGTPLLTQILFFFYVVAYGLGLQNRFVAGVIILSFFSSAYLAEMIRASIDTIPQAQWESAKVLGLSRFQTYRYIIMPQALRHLMPSLAGQCASLIKDSSLLSMIGLPEFTLAAQQVNSATYSTLESFFPLAIGYLVLTLPLFLGSRWLEQKLK